MLQLSNLTFSYEFLRFFTDEVHSFVTIGIVPRVVHTGPQVCAVLVTFVIIREIVRPVIVRKFGLWCDPYPLPLDHSVRAPDPKTGFCFNRRSLISIWTNCNSVKTFNYFFKDLKTKRSGSFNAVPCWCSDRAWFFRKLFSFSVSISTSLDPIMWQKYWNNFFLCELHILSWSPEKLQI